MSEINTTTTNNNTNTNNSTKIPYKDRSKQEQKLVLHQAAALLQWLEENNLGKCVAKLKTGFKRDLGEEFPLEELLAIENPKGKFEFIKATDYDSPVEKDSSEEEEEEESSSEEEESSSGSEEESSSSSGEYESSSEEEEEGTDDDNKKKKQKKKPTTKTKGTKNGNETSESEYEEEISDNDNNENDNDKAKKKIVSDPTSGPKRRKERGLGNGNRKATIGRSKSFDTSSISSNEDKINSKSSKSPTPCRGIRRVVSFCQDKPTIHNIPSKPIGDEKDLLYYNKLEIKQMRMDSDKEKQLENERQLKEAMEQASKITGGVFLGMKSVFD